MLGWQGERTGEPKQRNCSNRRVADKSAEVCRALNGQTFLSVALYRVRR